MVGIICQKEYNPFRGFGPPFMILPLITGVFFFSPSELQLDWDARIQRGFCREQNAPKTRGDVELILPADD